MHKDKVLVVDDEIRICRMLKKFFSGNGYNVRSVDSGAAAIKLLKNEEFDLVLCDYVMSGVSGYDVIKALDELDKRPKVGLITDWCEKIETKEKEELKVDFIVRRPIGLSGLKKHINDVLNAASIC